MVRQLEQGVVAKKMRITKVRQTVFGRAIPYEGCRLLVQHARLANQVQAHIGHGNVFFEHRTVAAPFAIALSQYDGVVRQMQQVVDVRCVSV